MLFHRNSGLMRYRDPSELGVVSVPKRPRNNKKSIARLSCFGVIPGQVRLERPAECRSEIPGAELGKTI